MSGTCALDHLAGALGFPPIDHHGAIARKRGHRGIQFGGIDSDSGKSVHVSFLLTAEDGRAFGSKGRHTLRQISCVGGEGAGEPLDRRVSVFTLSRVDHCLDHLDG